MTLIIVPLPTQQSSEIPPPHPRPIPRSSYGQSLRPAHQTPSQGQVLHRLLRVYAHKFQVKPFSKDENQGRNRMRPSAVKQGLFRFPIHAQFAAQGLDDARTRNACPPPLLGFEDRLMQTPPLFVQ